MILLIQCSGQIPELIRSSLIWWIRSNPFHWPPAERVTGPKIMVPDTPTNTRAQPNPRGEHKLTCSPCDSCGCEGVSVEAPLTCRWDWCSRILISEQTLFSCRCLKELPLSLWPKLALQSHQKQSVAWPAMRLSGIFISTATKLNQMCKCLLLKCAALVWSCLKNTYGSQCYRFHFSKCFIHLLLLMRLKWLLEASAAGLRFS